MRVSQEHLLHFENGRGALFLLFLRLVQGTVSGSWGTASALSRELIYRAWHSAPDTLQEMGSRGVFSSMFVGMMVSLLSMELRNRAYLA